MRNEKEYKSFLDEESSYTVERSDNDRSSKSKGSVLSRQTKLIIVLAAFLAVTLSPINLIICGVGPINFIPCASTISAKSAFSDKKP